MESKACGPDDSREVLRGIFIARLDQILGAIPFHMYPRDFITGEQARDVAVEAMLLFMFGRDERTASIMGFERLDFVGYGLADFDSALGDHVVLALFDSNALKFLWQKYNTIKYFLVNVSEAIKKRLSIDDALKNFYDEINASWIDRHAKKNTAIERDVARTLHPQMKSLVDSVSLVIESVISEAVAQQPRAVKESVWQKIEKVVETYIEFSNTYFGEEFTKTEILPHLLRKN